MNTKKSLAKVFGPVLLLTATLAMPMDTAFAAKEQGRRAAHAQVDKHENKKGRAQQRHQGRRADQQRQEQKRLEVRRQQQSNHRHKAVQQHRIERQKEQKRAEIRRQQALKVQQDRIERQRALQVRQDRIERQRALQLRQNRIERQQALEHQRALERQRAFSRQQALERQRALDRQRLLQRQRQNRAYRYDDRYYATPRRGGGGGGGADPNVFHVDGWLDAGGDCLFLNDHEGRTWAMVGNTYGLEPGEHVRLYGRPVYGGACGHGAAFDIYEVRTVWADNNHRRTYYDHLYDGPFDQTRAYDDDRYYNGTYDPYEDRNDRDSWWERIFGG